MPPKEKRYMKCPTCYTLIAFLNGVCPDCGGTGVMEEKEPTQDLIPQGNPKPKSVPKNHWTGWNPV